MHRIKLLVPALVLLALPALAWRSTQDKEEKRPQGRPQGTSARVNFAIFTYTDTGGRTTSVQARDLIEVRLLHGQQEHMRLELLYQNGDYSMVDAHAFHLVRKSEAGGSDVVVTRAEPAAIVFPFVN